MGTETPAENASMRFSQRHSAYLVSAFLHVALAIVVLTMLPEQVKVADVVHVKIMDLAPEGVKGPGQPAESPARAGRRPGSPSPVLPAKRQKSLPSVVREPEKIKQSRDSENTPATGASTPVLESGPALPGGGSQGGTSDGNDSGTKGGGSSAGQDAGGRGQGSQNSGTGPAKSDFLAYHAAVRARIEAAKHYPMAARKRHMEGDVEVSFRLSREGRLLALKISRSSGIGFLDDAALAAVKDGTPYPRYPGGEDEMPTSMMVNIAFVLK